MKKLRLLVCFVILLTCFTAVPNPKQSQALVGWVGTAGSPYIGSAATQPMDINVSGNSGNLHSPNFRLDSKGYPHVVWSDNSYGNYERVKPS